MSNVYTLELKNTGTVDVTPALLARIFWKMDDSQQAEFFEALYEETANTSLGG